jgi:hypothetical protein
MKKSLFISIACLFAFVTSNATISIIMPNMTGPKGTLITIPVKVTNFQNLIAMQGTIQFDHAIVHCKSIQGFGLQYLDINDFGFNDTATGKLTFAWTDDDLSGKSLSDSSVVFSVTFKIVGNPGQTSPLSFINTPTQMEFSDVSYNVVPNNPVNGSITVSSVVGVNQTSAINDGIQLLNYPNPFSEETNIEFSFPSNEQVIISIFDINGKEIDRISREFLAGKHSFVWDAKDLNGRKLPNGAYYVRLQSGNYCAMRKMIIW